MYTYVYVYLYTHTHTYTPIYTHRPKPGRGIEARPRSFASPGQFYILPLLLLTTVQALLSLSLI